MTPGTIFISHRAEYAELARKLKKIIQDTSRGKLPVFISEDIPHGENWRSAIEQQLRESETLFLLYGAPHEDWSWCFYEAGYFEAIRAVEDTTRRILCLARPDTPPPRPLGHLQVVTDKEGLIKALLTIYKENKVEHDAVEVRASIDGVSNSFFGRLTEFVGYPQIYFTVTDSIIQASQHIPADMRLTADESVMKLLFGIGTSSISWGDVASIVARAVPEQQQFFVTKWIEETSDIILAARHHWFKAPQTVLVGPAGRRFRFLLYAARTEGDGTYRCEFLAIDEVGGPPLGLPNQLLSLLTGIRMGFRLRYELIRRFPDDEEFSDEDSRARIKEIPRIIDNLSAESAARGNFNLDDLLAAFSDEEGARIQKIVDYWPSLKKELYDSLGISSEGKVIDDRGLRGRNLNRYRAAFNGIRLINLEFLSRCCACVARLMARSEDQLKHDAVELDKIVRSLRKVEDMIRDPADRLQARKSVPRSPRASPQERRPRNSIRQPREYG